MTKISITVKRKVTQNPTRLKLAYIKHQFERYGFEGAEQSEDGITFFPDVITFQNTGKPVPVGSGAKGNPVFVRSPFWRFIESLNAHDIRSWRYTRSIGAMWINTWYDQSIPYSLAKAEPILCGGNFISYTDETTTHVKVQGFDNGLKADQVLDPAVHNWRDMPYMFWKACSVERFGSIVRNVTSGLDVYFPIIEPHSQFQQPAEIWIEKRKIEMLGENEYTFQNGDVYVDGKLFRESGVVKPK